MKRRKEQNRAAQRAFRERKERQVQDLNLQVESLVTANKQLLEKIDAQQKTIEDLQTHIVELEGLKDFRCEDWVTLIGSYGNEVGEDVEFS